ncbi:MAG TPA: hypothetical protein PKE15_07175, partial [Ottowia sp.]|nr:hypothetical protein [Ottowia sp.]
MVMSKTRSASMATGPEAAEQAMPAIAVAGVSPATGDAPARGEAKHREASGDWGRAMSISAFLARAGKDEVVLHLEGLEPRRHA